MPTNNVNELVAETRKLIAEVEAGDTEHAAWVAIQDRVERLCSQRTQKQVAELLDKDDRWVRTVSTWDRARAPHPNWRSGSNKRTDVVTKVLRDPEKRKEAFEALDLEDAEKVMSDALRVVEQKSPNPNRRRKREQREFSDEAHNHTELAWDHLRARTSLFADVPVSERETQQLEWCRMVVEQLLGDEMDDELREVLENA